MQTILVLKAKIFSVVSAHTVLGLDDLREEKNPKFDSLAVADTQSGINTSNRARRHADWINTPSRSLLFLEI